MVAALRLKAEHVPWTKLHRQWDIRLYLISALPCYFWGQFVLGLNTQSWVQWSAQFVGGSAAIGLMLYVLVRFLIGDPLLERRFKAAQYFRGEFPSAKIAASYSLELAHARQVWRDYYDTWQFRQNVNFEKYLATTSVGYQCRTVVLFRAVLVVLGVVGGAAMIGQEWRHPSSLASQPGSLLSVAYLIAGGSLFLWHRLPRDSQEPTGCWLAWRIRNEENLQTFIRDLKGRDIPAFWADVTAQLAELRAATRKKWGL